MRMPKAASLPACQPSRTLRKPTETMEQEEDHACARLIVVECENTRYLYQASEREPRVCPVPARAT